MGRMRLVFFASGEFAVPSLHRIAAGNDEVLGLVTQPSRPRGRGRKPAPTPAAEAGASLGLTLIESAEVNGPDVLGRLREIRPDLGIVIAFGQKLGRGLLDTFRFGCINLHASLLPKYRGAAPIAWAILAGETVTGVSVFRLTERMDAGDILVQRETPIGPQETAGELHDRLAEIGADAVRDAVDCFRSNPDPPGVPQAGRPASIAPKLSKQAGRLDLRLPAIRLDRHIRAMWPWPGARCLFRSRASGHAETVTLCRSRVADPNWQESNARPGSVDEEGRVVAGRGLVQVLEIQPAGGRVMSWAEFARGRHVRPGDRFETLESGEPTSRPPATPSP